jgi:nucleoside-diphosphate-sugar epimerase
MNGRVLLTGATGFIGRPALRALAPKDLDVHAVIAPGHKPPEQLPDANAHPCDLLDPAATSTLIRRVKPDHLLHLAWYTQPPDYPRSGRNLTWLAASLHLLRAFAQAGGRRAVTAGTCMEYLWSNEPCHERRTPCTPSTLYGTCKDALRRVGESLAETSELSLAHGRVFFLFGPGEKPRRLIPSIILSLLAGEKACCRRAQLQRDFLHVSDTAGALVELLCSPVTGPVNIASGHAVALGEIAQRLAAKLSAGDRLEIRHEEAHNEPIRLVADVTRLTREVGFQPKLQLDQALDETLSYWRASE